MIRRFVPVALALATAISLGSDVHAQLKPGLHVARAAESFGGVNGIGGSLKLSVPVLPIDFVVAGEYFFPGCDECSLWGGSLDVHFPIRIPIVSPYGAVGLVTRSIDVSDTKVRTGGFGVGGGVNVGMAGFGAFGEARYEILGDALDQLVFRLGVRF